MYNVLLVSSSEKGVDAVNKLFRDSSFSVDTVAQSSAQARQLLMVRQFCAIVINCPLKDEFGTELAIDVSKNQFCPCFVVVRSELVSTCREKLEPLGIAVEQKPFDREEFLHAMMFLSAVNDKYRTIIDENKKLHDKLDEIKLVNRAKRVLMECLKMSEPLAHRYIEKQAMDLRITRKEVAETIIKTYTDSY